MYLPDLKTMRIAKNFLLGDCFCMLCTDCVSNQAVQYRHVLFVVRPPSREPNFAVAAEVNEMAEEGRALLRQMREQGASEEQLAADAELVGSHYLGVFPGDGHRNLGASDDWADLDKFAVRALQIVAQEFGITSAPVERPVLTQQALPAGAPANAGPSRGMGAGAVIAVLAVIAATIAGLMYWLSG
jgi:hypothetical protein